MEDNLEKNWAALVEQFVNRNNCSIAFNSRRQTEATQKL